MKGIYNFINKYKKEIIVILILIIISIGIYYFYYRENFINEGFFTTTTAIIGPKQEQLGDDINGESSHDNSGSSVSLSSDGTIVVIEAPYYNDESGNVRIYKISPIDCVGSFENDGECSETYGGGKQKQIYRIKNVSTIWQ